MAQLLKHGKDIFCMRMAHQQTCLWKKVLTAFVGWWLTRLSFGKMKPASLNCAARGKGWSKLPLIMKLPGQKSQWGTLHCCVQGQSHGTNGSQILAGNKKASFEVLWGRLRVLTCYRVVNGIQIREGQHPEELLPEVLKPGSLLRQLSCRSWTLRVEFEPYLCAA